MPTRLALPWFLPPAAVAAYACSRAAFRLCRSEDRKGRRTWSALLMLSLGWYPFLAWGLAQFLPQFPR